MEAKRFVRDMEIDDLGEFKRWFTQLFKVLITVFSIVVGLLEFTYIFDGV